MNIGQMFAKSINREIKPVVKPGQVDEATVKLELQEYVVTQELQKHFAAFFSNYRLGIGADTDRIGVWISGFFGSGLLYRGQQDHRCQGSGGYSCGRERRYRCDPVRHCLQESYQQRRQA